MKLHLTNLYGMAGDSTVILAQNAVQKIASQLGFREFGIYFYNIASDSPSEMNSVWMVSWPVFPLGIFSFFNLQPGMALSLIVSSLLS